MIDGYEDIPPEAQEKVLRAIHQGHIDDEDWKYDVEKNRPGEKGFRNTPKKKKKKGGDVSSSRLNMQLTALT